MGKANLERMTMCQTARAFHKCIEDLLVDQHCRQWQKTSSEGFTDGLKVWSADTFLLPRMQGAGLSHTAHNLRLCQNVQFTILLTSTYLVQDQEDIISIADISNSFVITLNSRSAS